LGGSAALMATVRRAGWRTAVSGMGKAGRAAPAQNVHLQRPVTASRLCVTVPGGIHGSPVISSTMPGAPDHVLQPGVDGIYRVGGSMRAAVRGYEREQHPQPLGKAAR
jgi:hypothetical protein